eukprot:CAMPEP_0173096734 /NCGR_PEP_ID=MMETSP1102-20130122/33225_1 /TAXON_ID=49646 /ORGANISM="Geminigera sp., Strain Caron Lab Isolate" /LENGTH=79 /DNA_ID=CAMNT_0013987923 /DNA_START=735 /DNA_END=971 /DNA_ORIENTATION=-
MRAFLPDAPDAADAPAPESMKRPLAVCILSMPAFAASGMAITPAATTLRRSTLSDIMGLKAAAVPAMARTANERMLNTP